MKRFESGYEMKIVMKPDASEKQLEIARKLYPKALVLRGLEAAKIDFKHCERFTKLLKEMADQEKDFLNDCIEKKVSSSTNKLPKNIYKKVQEQSIIQDKIMAFAA